MILVPDDLHLLITIAPRVTARNRFTVPPLAGNVRFQAIAVMLCECRRTHRVVDGRVEMWRGCCRLNISVSASFVWRCLSGSAMAPFPHPAHRTGHAALPHPTLGQDLTPLLSRATPSAVSEHFSEFDRLPNLQVRHHVLRLS